jgi:hypothetical protein
MNANLMTDAQVLQRMAADARRLTGGPNPLAERLEGIATRLDELPPPMPPAPGPDAPQKPRAWYQFPSMNEDLLHMLRLSHSTLGPIARVLRRDGIAIPQDSSSESAYALHFLLSLYFEFGDLWAGQFTERMTGMIRARMRQLEADPTEKVDPVRWAEAQRQIREGIAFDHDYRAGDHSYTYPF